MSTFSKKQLQNPVHIPQNGIEKCAQLEKCQHFAATSAKCQHFVRRQKNVDILQKVVQKVDILQLYTFGVTYIRRARFTKTVIFGVDFEPFPIASHR